MSTVYFKEQKDGGKWGETKRGKSRRRKECRCAKESHLPETLEASQAIKSDNISAATQHRETRVAPCHTSPIVFQDDMSLSALIFIQEESKMLREKTGVWFALFILIQLRSTLFSYLVQGTSTDSSAASLTEHTYPVILQIPTSALASQG